MCAQVTAEEDRFGWRRLPERSMQPGTARARKIVKFWHTAEGQAPAERLTWPFVI